ncbi:hypothetical protein F3Y22_tig00111014pilonHSYRG00024 [Hibiscus syriacus]|uniref:Uncharacterized protein n=1 Tax=Hibiscus syriacus TaxID=106335 RepID=A0A6A2Z8M8_HIBSY|nr:hypothetical protein F3Y22_tig00111014pilonHSYRG00024 [Hibiscus syriacus]
MASSVRIIDGGKSWCSWMQIKEKGKKIGKNSVRVRCSSYSSSIMDPYNTLGSNEALLGSQYCWDIIEDGYTEPENAAAATVLTNEEKKLFRNGELKLCFILDGEVYGQGGDDLKLEVSIVFFLNCKQVGYYFAPCGKPYPDNWIITDIIYEVEGSVPSRSGNQVEGNPGATSEDETVTYHSLSWCKNCLEPRVNITRAPQSEHDGSDVQVELNIEHHNEDIVPNMTRSPRVKYITYYEDP